MTQEPHQSKNQIPVPVEEFPDRTDAELAEIARLRDAGADARAALATPTNGKRMPPDRDVSESAAALALLALGGLTYGAELLRRRADRANAVIAQQRRAATLPGQATIPDEELARYALMGLVLKAPDVIADGLSAVGGVVDATAGVAYAVAGPVLHSRLLKPFRDSFNGFAQRGESMVQELAQLGQQGQAVSKELVEDATVNAMNNVVGVVAESEEVRELVQQQTVSLFQEFLAFIQDRLRNMDLRIQRVAFRIIPGDQSDRTNEKPLELPMPPPNRVLLLRSPQRRAE